MLCEMKDGKLILIFEEGDCEPLLGNYSLWDTVVFEDPFLLPRNDERRI